VRPPSNVNRLSSRGFDRDPGGSESLNPYKSIKIGKYSTQDENKCVVHAGLGRTVISVQVPKCQLTIFRASWLVCSHSSILQSRGATTRRLAVLESGQRCCCVTTPTPIARLWQLLVVTNLPELDNYIIVTERMRPTARWTQTVIYFNGIVRLVRVRLRVVHCAYNGNGQTVVRRWNKRRRTGTTMIQILKTTKTYWGV
jgi:hypothetical protein